MISESLSGPRIAIIGGGFSGTLVLAHLVRESGAPLTIDVFESSGNMATGVAYSTIDIAHLLNVRTDRMGAFPDDVRGFYTWLHDDAGKKQVGKLWPGYEVREDGYVPRMFYATYLKHVLEEALKLARTKDIHVHVHHASVIDIEQGDTLRLSVEKSNSCITIDADAVVLATGNLPPRRFSFEQAVSGTGRYVPDIWSPAWDNTIHAVGKLSPKSHIVVIGSGLTAVDAILTLEEENFPGTVIAISRHGRLPATHIDVNAYPEWDWTLHPENAPNNLLGLLRGIRKEIKKAAGNGYDWRSVIDSLRPVTQPVWQKLSLSQKRIFMRRLFAFWNIHRHRMAPEVGGEIANLKKNGRLKVIAGHILQVSKNPHSLNVTYHRQGGHRETLEAALVINCTGPEYNVAACPHPLLNRLSKRGLITPHPLGLGMETTESGATTGCDAIFPIGTMLIGELLECTAVPEVREQAHETARRVLQRIKYNTMDKTYRVMTRRKT